MRTLIAAAMLLALTSFSHAETCTGRARIDVETVGDGLYPKGTKLLTVGDCVIESRIQEKRVLRTCPLGSRCRVEGVEGGDATLETITSVTRVDPYQEGVRDYRKGLCFRARPYSSNSPEGKLWERGYEAQQKKRDEKYRHRRYVEWPPHCHPGQSR